MRQVLLAYQVAGVLAGGLMVVLLARASHLQGRQAAATVAAVTIAVAALFSVPNLRTAVGTFLDQRQLYGPLTREEEGLAPGVAAGVDVEFVGWADQRLVGKTFHVLVGESIDEARAGLILQWILFQLAPKLSVLPESAADRVVFYDVAPARYSGLRYRDVEVYQPGYAIASVRDGA
jgi:hypothetical protein